MATVTLDRISKRFGSADPVVDEISLEIRDREFLVLVGPSGCGKSTTLRMIAGLETITTGEIRIGERVVNNSNINVAPKDRDIAMVFQNYALYPHMSVYKNLSFGLTLRFGGGVIARGLSKIFQPRRAKQLAAQQSAELPDGIDGQVRQTAARLGIEHLLDRQPHQLSGGERQRVALGRAIVRNPAAFLFDEPLSNLDAKLRQQMRVELRRLHRELQATMIYVTHDQVEAMTLGDRVAVMNGGKILQVGPPMEIYQSPANLFVARFIGSVPMNLLTHPSDLIDSLFKEAEKDSGQPGIANQEPRAKQQAHEVTNQERSSKYRAHEVVLGIRAENISIASHESETDITGTVTVVDQLGESTLAYVQLDDENKSLESAQPSGAEIANSFDEPETVGRRAPGPGSSNQNNLEQNNLDRTGQSPKQPSTKNQEPSTRAADPLLTIRLPPTSAVNVGDRLNLHLDRDKILWFDSASGQNLRKQNT